MIRFQQIRNATVKLCYLNATFLIDPWLSPTCTPEERDAALHEHRFIELLLKKTDRNENFLSASSFLTCCYPSAAISFWSASSFLTCCYPSAAISFWISSKRLSSVSPERPASASSSLSGRRQRIFSVAPILATMASSFFGVTLFST